MDDFIFDGPWLLKEEPISVDASQYLKVINSKKDWIETNVPGDIHDGLLKAGQISEPLIGLNSFDSEWIENRSWWFKNSFKTRSEWPDADLVELELDGLDSMADIFLNGKHLGKHISAFRPFIADITKLLKGAGKNNQLVVRLTSGLEHIKEEDIKELEEFINTEHEHGRGLPGKRGDKRRAYIRKPQYVYGWDWNPRVPTCGITGGVRLISFREAAIRDVFVTSEFSEDKTRLVFKVNLENFNWVSTKEALLSIKVTDEKGGISKKDEELFLRSGNNFISTYIEIDDPVLWWPNGMGEQYLYTLEVKVLVEGRKEITFQPFKYGIREIVLDQSVLDKDSRLFRFRVNGEEAYCRGANWVPVDSVYGRIPEEKYHNLLVEAKEANINMLRIWGGGIYEKDCFYKYCDKYGIMVWQDLMFACAAYPDHENWFLEEVKKEIDYQTKRLRNHPCITVWCGNNENQWAIIQDWDEKTRGGIKIYNKIIPEILNKNGIELPYWNSSPYGGKHPNSKDIGDMHIWYESMMNPDMDVRTRPEVYDSIDPKFVSEYGYMGPCMKKTIDKYLDGAEFNRESEVWKHHNNTMEKGVVLGGINKHYMDIDNLSNEEYLLYGGLCHGLMYEYSLDSFRAKRNCSGALIWMFADCWGEVGLSILDYYQDRKIAYHFVRRANNPIRLILRRNKHDINILLANDTSGDLKEELEYGYMSFDSEVKEVDIKEVTISKFDRKNCCKIIDKGFDLKKGCFFARLKNLKNVIPAIYRSSEFRNLILEKPDIFITDLKEDNNISKFIISTDKFAHAVHFNLSSNYRLTDEYFDLLSGERREIIITGGPISKDILRPKSVLVK